MLRKFIPLPEFTKADKIRFWGYVYNQEPDDCWVWLAGKCGSAGHGLFKHRSTTLYAHRISWFLARDSDPEEFLICHTCNNPPCCNPFHLYKGTSSDNSKDSFACGNSNRRGSAHPGALLHEFNVLEIRRLCRETSLSYRQIGDKFGVSLHVVYRINRRLSWTHI